MWEMTEIALQQWISSSMAFCVWEVVQRISNILGGCTNILMQHIGGLYKHSNATYWGLFKALATHWWLRHPQWGPLGLRCCLEPTCARWSIISIPLFQTIITVSRRFAFSTICSISCKEILQGCLNWDSWAHWDKVLIWSQSPVWSNFLKKSWKIS